METNNLNMTTININNLEAGTHNGYNVINENPVNNISKSTNSEPIIITLRDIISSFAYCITKASPYPIVDNLVDILKDIREHLIGLGYKDELIFTDKFNGNLYVHMTYSEIYKQLESVRDNVKSFNTLNITKWELDKGITDVMDDNRPVKFGVSGRGIENPRDRDFIDLDACIRNVCGMLKK